jgi:hypothetical protein
VETGFPTRPRSKKGADIANGDSGLIKVPFSALCGLKSSLGPASAQKATLSKH